MMCIQKSQNTQINSFSRSVTTMCVQGRLRITPPVGISDMQNNVSASIAYLTGQWSENPSPPAITTPEGGGKFDHNGQVLAWPGNTFICHLNPHSSEHKTLSLIQKQLKAGPHSNAFAFLPPDSFHMTIMEGISGAPESDPSWPKNSEKNLDLHTATDLIRQRLTGVIVPDSHQIKVADIFAGHCVKVEGFNDDQERSLRRTREILRDTAGVKRRAFSAYQFHITLAYLTRLVEHGGSEFSYGTK